MWNLLQYKTIKCLLRKVRVQNGTGCLHVAYHMTSTTRVLYVRTLKMEGSGHTVLSEYSK